MTQQSVETAVRDEGAARLRETLEHTPNVSVQWYDLDGRVTYWNPASETVFGYTAAEAVGRTLDELILSPDGTAAFNTILRRLHRDGGWTEPTEFAFHRKDGSRGVCLSTIFSLPSATGEPTFACMDVDITARQAAERALRDREARLRAVFAALPDHVFVLDSAGRHLEVHSPRSELLAVPVEQIVGKTVRDLFPADLAAKLEELTGEALRSGAVRFIEYPTQMHGRSVWLEARLVPCGEDRVLVIVRDRSEQKEAETRRARAEEHLRQAQKLESLGVMAAGIAHDFNNLLTGILGYTGLARACCVGDCRGNGYLDQIEETSRRAADLCRQMLAYAGHGRIVTNTIDLTRLVREVAGLSFADGRAIVRFDADDEPLPVEGDEAQLRQVVFNVLTNAAEAIGTSSGVVQVRTGRVVADHATLTAAVVDDDLPPGEYAVAEVVDSGCGMDAGQVGRIFDPFYSTKSPGRGLGLAAALGTVRAHRGAVVVTSEPGRGTAFRILLPVAATDVPLVAAAPPGRALVIDGDAESRQRARTVLESTGYSVTCVGDGPGGLAAVRRSCADVVLLDLTLPKLAGLDVLSELRRLAPAVPVVLTSGFRGEEVRRLIDVPGPVRYLRKPFAADELSAAVEAARSAALRA